MVLTDTCKIRKNEVITIAIIIKMQCNLNSSTFLFVVIILIIVIAKSEVFVKLRYRDILRTLFQRIQYMSVTLSRN